MPQSEAAALALPSGLFYQFERILESSITWVGPHFCAMECLQNLLTCFCKSQIYTFHRCKIIIYVPCSHITLYCDPVRSNVWMNRKVKAFSLSRKRCMIQKLVPAVIKWHFCFESKREIISTWWWMKWKRKIIVFK